MRHARDLVQELKELAWAAGLFEANGSATRQKRRPVRLQLKMTARESVLRFRDAVDLGTVYGPYEHIYKDGHARRPYYLWLADGDQAEEVAAALQPHLSQHVIEKIRAAIRDQNRGRP